MLPQFDTSISRRAEVTFAKGEWLTCKSTQATARAIRRTTGPKSVVGNVRSQFAHTVNWGETLAGRSSLGFEKTTLLTTPLTTTLTMCASENRTTKAARHGYLGISPKRTRGCRTAWPGQHNRYPCFFCMSCSSDIDGACFKSKQQRKMRGLSATPVRCK